MGKAQHTWMEGGTHTWKEHNYYIDLQ